MDEWFCKALDSPKNRQKVEFDEVLVMINRLIELIQQRLDEIKQADEDRVQLDRDIQQAEIEKLGVQQPELFSQYQRSISRDLQEALDRLEAMRERKIKGSMGSFGQTAAGEERG